jgi:hypothetical protein
VKAGAITSVPGPARPGPASRQAQLRAAVQLLVVIGLRSSSSSRQLAGASSNCRLREPSPR